MAERASGSIYELGYQRYAGARLGRRHAVWALYTQSLRSVFGIGRSGWAKAAAFGLLVIALLPAVAQLSFAAIAPREVDVIPPQDYYGLIEPLLAIFCAIIAPELVGRDQRTKTLSLYFSRALRREDYAIARYAAMVTAMLAMTVLPQLLMFAGNMSASTDVGSYLRDNWQDLPAIAASALLLSALVAGIGLAIACQTSSRTYATVAIVAAFLLTTGIAAAVFEAAGAQRREVRAAVQSVPRGARLHDLDLRLRPDRRQRATDEGQHARLGVCVRRRRVRRRFAAHRHPAVREDLRMTNEGRQHGVIEAANVTRWYGSVVAVNDVSFSLGPGVTGLLGPNGAGKSTILHMLAGFLEPSSGTLHVGGAPAWRNHHELYRTTGLVPEREAVFPFLTGHEFVLLNARLQHLPDPEAATRRALQLVGMEYAEGRKLGGYSKGMKQRIKVASAIVHDPQVLLLDEPFNGTDPRQRLEMMDLLRKMAAEGRTIVFSSHILDEVERLAERVLVIVSGRLAASGDFRAIRQLMTDRPHAFTVASSDDRRLAQALVGHPTVVGVEIGKESLTVRTAQYLAFTRVAPRLAREQQITLRELVPTDESLESVFSYLVNR